MHLKFTHSKWKLHHPGDNEFNSPAPWIPWGALLSASSNRFFMLDDLTSYGSMHNTTRVTFSLPNWLQNFFSFPTDIQSLQMCTTKQVEVFNRDDLLFNSESLNEKYKIIDSQFARQKCQWDINQSTGIVSQGNALWNCCVQNVCHGVQASMCQC